MALVVMKFGGSSVADVDKIKDVAKKVVVKKNAGNKVIVVVSAVGDTTDDLLEMVSKITSTPPLREMDVLLATGEMVSISLLAIAIDSLGEKAISMTGPQAGIVANSQHTRAKIMGINPQKIIEHLEKNNIVVVAGFQALNPEGDITTLGRGGSDLTAIALAAAIKADCCELYSDVEGVYTADPRIVENARKIDYISYDEMLEMAGSGAQILQLRSVEVAKKFGVEVCSRSTFSENYGTIITSIKKIKEGKVEQAQISGITFDKNQAKFTIIDLVDIPNATAEIFCKLAKNDIGVDMIVQSAVIDKKNSISFIVSRQDMKKTQAELDRLMCKLKYATTVCDEHVAKVSIVGIGIKSNVAAVTAKMFEMFYRESISIKMVSISELKISCIVDELDMVKAVKKLHKEFELFEKM
jgi:aspartate kinase